MVMVPIGIVVVLAIVVFLLGVVAPRKSRRAQRVRDRVMKRGERKADRRAGKPGDLAKGGIHVVRRIADRVAEGGRRAHEAAMPDRD
jgi:hypothetical protein